MYEQDAKSRFDDARVARLSTVDGHGQPHLVPVVFALEDNTLWIAIDQKPKTTTNLKRLRNIEANDRVSVLVDEYVDNDWSRLWWVRADGSARVLGEQQRAHPIELLTSKYRQHADEPPRGPVIEVAVDTWRWWSGKS